MLISFFFKIFPIRYFLLILYIYTRTHAHNIYYVYVTMKDIHVLRNVAIRSIKIPVHVYGSLNSSVFDFLDFFRSVFYFLSRLSKMSHSHLSTRQQTGKAYILTYTRCVKIHIFPRVIPAFLYRDRDLSACTMKNFGIFKIACYNSRLFVRRIITRYNLHLLQRAHRRQYSTHIQYINNYNLQQIDT